MNAYGVLVRPFCRSGTGDQSGFPRSDRDRRRGYHAKVTDPRTPIIVEYGTHAVIRVCGWCSAAAQRPSARRMTFRSGERGSGNSGGWMRSPFPRGPLLGGFGPRGPQLGHGAADALREPPPPGLGKPLDCAIDLCLRVGALGGLYGTLSHGAGGGANEACRVRLRRGQAVRGRPSAIGRRSGQRNSATAAANTATRTRSRAASPIAARRSNDPTA